jgi:hypothetical protein
MAEDDNGRSWELTMRGLKRWQWLRFPGGVATAVGVDKRQAGWGCSRRAPCEEKGAWGEKLGLAVTDAFYGWGGRAVGRGRCAGGTTQRRRTWGAWRGARAALSDGSGLTLARAGRRRVHA